jgi:Predicted helicases
MKCRLPEGLAEFVVEKHEEGTQTLVVVNTVQRAQEVFWGLEKLLVTAEKQAKNSTLTHSDNLTKKPEIKLLHSRFRPAERNRWREILNDKDENGNKKSVNRIIVATQVVEAGVDVSSKLLISDIAPFSSMVQRFGRCNRSGEYEQAEVFWIDLPLREKDRGKDFAEKDFDEIEEKKLLEFAKPYEIESLKKAKAILESLDSVSPNILEKLDYTEPFVPNHVLRRRDLVDLFDTTADLSGFDLDVSRFVRGGNERDVSFFWREKVEETIKKKDKKELAKILAPHRDELCPVPIYEAKSFLSKKKAWTFDALSGEWREVSGDNLRTGMIILLDAESGGYDRTGWNPKSKKTEIVEVGTKNDKNKSLQDESFEDDILTKEPSPLNKFFRYTQTLASHSREVKQAAEKILEKLGLPELDKFSAEISSAAHHHDLGKAHEVFQETLRGDDKDSTKVLAKSKKGGHHRRKKFRHELASALAMLERGKSDLEVYLAAAHHGKVRLSIRALPEEDKPKDDDGKIQSERKYARGIWEGDVLPATDLGDGVEFPETVLNLDALLLGRNGDGKPSWLERMLKLRDDLGVFRLAFLEAIVRAADVQASANPQDYFEKGVTEDAE